MQSDPWFFILARHFKISVSRSFMIGRESTWSAPVAASLCSSRSLSWERSAKLSQPLMKTVMRPSSFASFMALRCSTREVSAAFVRAVCGTLLSTKMKK